MDMRATLLEKYSRDQMLRIVDYVGDDQQKFDELLRHMLADETNRVVQRASWAVMHSVDAQPQLIQPHLKKIIENLYQPDLPDAVKRNTVRLLQNVDLPDSLLGIMAEIGFQFLNNPKEPVAVRVFSMTVLYNICIKEPELAEELKLVIEEHLPYGTAAFKSRGKKVLGMLKGISN